MNIPIISEDLFKKIIKKLEESGPAVVYHDYSDEVGDDFIHEAINKFDNPMERFWVEEIFDTYELELDKIKEVLKGFKNELEEEYGDDFTSIEEIAKDLRDSLIDYVEIDYDLKRLLKKESRVRMQLMSNYEGILSNYHNESTGGYCYSGYFKDMVKFLKLNPNKLKKVMVEMGIKVMGTFPRAKEGNELVDYKAFAEELLNNTAFSVLTFIGCINQYELLQGPLKKAKITIPKGTPLGLYSPWQGGGSIFDLILLRPVTIDMSKNKKYDFWKLSMEVKEDGYTINQTYGFVYQMWKSEFEIKHL